VLVLTLSLLAAVVLRFLCFSPMWLDEAQTVAIARRSLPHLYSALRHDGSPPLYYLTLHAWMSMFGESNVAVRSLSGVISVLTLPLMWLAARRLGADRRLAVVAVLLLALNPFAIRYATEARMYSLVTALWLAALLALLRWWRDAVWWSGVLGALAVAALVLTQYWAFFAVLAVGAWMLVAAWRGERRGWRVLAVLAIGCLGFIPWLDSFAYQVRHTGAPWGSPPSLATIVDLPFSWAGAGPLGLDTLLGLGYYALLSLAIARPLRRGGRRTAALLAGVALATMLVGVAVSEALGSAYAPRYSAIALAPFLLAVAWGVHALPSRWRQGAVAATILVGLVLGFAYPFRMRSQAGEVADVLRLAQPTDTVVFCPDQLGPAVHRIVPDIGRQLVYPTLGSPVMVDWVDYKMRNKAANPAAFAKAVEARTPRGSAIWYVYANDYPTFSDSCTQLLVDLALARGAPEPEVRQKGSSFEEDNLLRYPPVAPAH
jgi:4-amino-4-deoxy-L-arabinose transferase-like glycosyltransferase